MSLGSILSSFKLQKLKIFSYLQASRDGLPKVFEVMFNPESVSHSFDNRYQSNPVDHNSTKNDYAFRPPSLVRMKLIFDDSGVNDYLTNILADRVLGRHQSVPDRVNDFLKLAVYPEGEIHAPMNLTIEWGKTLNFNCVLTSVNINYTLFSRGGTPLRAELDVEFKEDDIPVATEIKANFQSPDLTHYRMIKAGDQLPSMCEEIYGSPHYYLYVAKVNELDDLRSLKPGQEIYFPPIKK